MGTRKNFTVPGGITVDTSTLYVDDPNNRVGIVNTSPTYTLDVAGIIRGTGGVIGVTSSGAPSLSIADGAFIVDTTNHEFYFRSGSTWRKLSNSVSVQDSAPTATTGTFWYESSTGKLFIGYDGYWIEVASAGPMGPTGSTGSTGSTGATGPAVGAVYLAASAGADVTTTQNTLQSVTGMSFSIGANETYYFDCHIIGQCSGAGGSKFGVNAPTGAVVEAAVNSFTNSATANRIDRLTALNTASATALWTVGNTALEARFTGVIVNSSTAGTVQIQFQSVTSGQTTTIREYSSLLAVKQA